MKRPRIQSSSIQTSANPWTARKRLRQRLIDLDPNKEEKRLEDDLEHLFEDLEGCIQTQMVRVHARENHIYFQSDVSKKSVEKLVELLDKQNEEYEKLSLNKKIKRLDPEPIYLHITSGGGDLLMGFLAVDAIKNSKVPVHTIIDGYAASAASLMAVVGKKRLMTKHSVHLIHQLSSAAWGKFSEIEDDYFNCKMFMNQIVDIYMEHTKMTKSVLEDQLKHDSWWNSEKCLEVDLVDELTK